MINNVSSHYDALIDENNDPVFDPEPLKKHMDLWMDKNKNKYIECNGRTIEIYPDDPETTKTHLHNAKFVVESVIETEAAYLFSAKK